MKLRAKNNSIRLRLTQSEVSKFAETGRVEEAIEFGLEPPEKFIYALATEPHAKQISAIFTNNRIIVFVPPTEADEWTRTTKIGMETEQSIGDGKILKILIEKDFACLEPRPDEDESDSYPHPFEGKAC